MKNPGYILVLLAVAAGLVLGASCGSDIEPDIEAELPEKSYGTGFNIDDGAAGIDPSHDIVLTFGESVLQSSVNDDTFFLVPVPDDYTSDGFDPALCIAPDTPLAMMQAISDEQFSLTPIDRLDHVKRYAACAIGCDPLPDGIAYSDDTCAESTMVIFSTRDWMWIPHNKGVFGSMIGGLAIDFNNPDTVYVLTSLNGVYKSIDGGATWTAKNNGFPDDPWAAWPHMAGNLLTMDPNNSSVLYTNMHGKVYRTVDGAENWVESNNGIEVCAPHYTIAGVVVDPQDSNHLLAGHITSGCSGGIFESVDGGANWVQIAGSGTGNGFVSNDAWTVAIDPTDDQRMYSASIYQTFHYSHDGGSTWVKLVPPGADGNSSNVVVHPTDTNRIFLVNNNGLYMSDNYGLAGSWTDMTATVGGWRSIIGFAPWDPQTGYIASSTGFHESTDGGLSWSLIGHADLGLRSMAIHPTDPTIIYAGSASKGVYKFIWE